MVLVFFFDQKAAEKERVRKLEEKRDSDAIKWFEELKEERPDFYEKLFGSKDNRH